MQAPIDTRVAYVVKRYPKYSETFIVNEILAHEDAGLAVEIFALRGPEDTHFQDIISRVKAPVTYLPDRLQKTSDFWQSLRSSARHCPDIWNSLGEFSSVDAREITHGAALAAFVRLRGITHLHAHFATSATTVARMASRFASVPYSFTAHAKDIFHDTVDAADLASKIRAADTVVTISDYNFEYLCHQHPTQCEKIRRIYNGLDVTRFPYLSPRGRAPVIAAIGRLVEKKGFDVLIEACATLRARGIDFRCDIVGDGDQESLLRRRISAHQLDRQVRLLGPRPQREVIEIIQSAAVLAAPCIIGRDGNRDGLPTVVLEAMALGTPCVGTDVTGMPEALISEKTGLVVGQGNADALARSLAELLESESQRETLATGARALIERHFDVGKNAAEVRRLFVPGHAQDADRQLA